MCERERRFREAASGLSAVQEEIVDRLGSFAELGRALSRICRFGGRCRRPYSVAAHSLVTRSLAVAAGEPPLVLLACLLHDAGEVFCGDAVRRFKTLEQRDLERRVRGRIARNLCGPVAGSLTLPWTYVTRYDQQAGHAEWDILGPEGEPIFVDVGGPVVFTALQHTNYWLGVCGPQGDEEAATFESVAATDLAGVGGGGDT